MLKAFIKKGLRSAGLELKRVPKNPVVHDWERPVGNMQYLLEALEKRGLNCTLIMDIGANRAGWSRMAKKIYPESNFCLVEPQAEMKEYLDAFCREFKESLIIPKAVGAKNEVRVLTIWDDLSGSSFLPQPESRLLETGRQREIDITTIDDIIEQHKKGIPELIKLDIQGFELEALKGASSTFGVTEVYILEVSLFPFEIRNACICRSPKFYA